VVLHHYVNRLMDFVACMDVPIAWEKAIPSLPVSVFEPPKILPDRSFASQVPLYCRLSKKFYFSIELLPTVDRETGSFYWNKYQVDCTGSKLLLACPSNPFRWVDFLGRQLPEIKKSTEIVRLLEEFVIYIKSTELIAAIERVPVQSFHAERRKDAQSLADYLGVVPADENNAQNFLTDLSAALTSKNAQIANFNYERLEFLGDAVLGLLLSLTCKAVYKFQQKKSNDFLQQKAKEIGLDNVLLDTAPSVNKMATFLQRGLAHDKAKKVLADCLEAVIGAIFLHCSGLNASLNALVSMGITKPLIRGVEELQEEFSLARDRLAASIAVYETTSSDTPVGTMHTMREFLTGYRGKDSVRVKNFSDYRDGLEGLQAKIRKKADKWKTMEPFRF
jgi:Ribonuclease-III-like